MAIRHLIFISALALLLVLFHSSAQADEASRAGRDIAAKWQGAVVTVKVAAKTRLSYQGEESVKEDTQEVTGTCVDPSGLVVISLSASDPSEYITSMFEGEDTQGLKVTTEITDLKIRLADNRELPAKIILRDKDLDLAFLRPVKTPDKPLTALDLTHAAQPELLDQVVVMYRLGAIASRTLNATVDRVEAVVEKPRRFYVLGVPGTAAQVGSPVFALDGQPVGILLHRTRGAKNPDDADGMDVVIPVADIADAAQQAPDAAK